MTKKIAETSLFTDTTSELIHYRVDCELGLTHGKKIGEYAILRAKADGSGL